MISSKLISTQGKGLTLIREQERKTQARKEERQYESEWKRDPGL